MRSKNEGVVSRQRYYDWTLGNCRKSGKEYIITVQIYEAASKYPKVREFGRLMSYGAYSEFHLDLSDDLEYLFDDEVYEFPKELEWIFDVKK